MNGCTSAPTVPACDQRSHDADKHHGDPVGDRHVAVQPDLRDQSHHEQGSHDQAGCREAEVEVRVEEPKSASGERRKTPLLVLTSAEKRKSSMF